MPEPNLTMRDSHNIMEIKKKNEWVTSWVYSLC